MVSISILQNEHNVLSEIPMRLRSLLVGRILYVEVEVPDYGKVSVDVSYGGSFFAIVRDSDLGINVSTSPVNVISKAASAVFDAVRGTITIRHPSNDDLSFICGVVITDGNDEWSEQPTLNISVFGDEKIDRSPCGSGLTSRLAVQYHKRQISIGQKRVFQNGKTGSQFTGTVLRESTVGKHKGIVVEVKGRGHFCGEATFIREADVFGEGFLIK
ncbi:putative trans-L-3-hydroxyproline dehydratase [Apostichopus japonicus]|uniref:trans-L-3-hydroxyproline dehydratase n=1 Tax=Stichopus japonicus TaxID=307972 RepID=A0A2G8JCD7_STIJA|nr:putative trans-L-3-hydroxyproline dehydratase [Apostichopus japonicus]